MYPTHKAWINLWTCEPPPNMWTKDMPPKKTWGDLYKLTFTDGAWYLNRNIYKFRMFIEEEGHFRDFDEILDKSDWKISSEAYKRGIARLIEFKEIE